MITHFYNEWEAFPAQWLVNLQMAGHIPMGGVSQTSIKELTSAQCGETSHFFAGLGGWPLALRMVGWPEDFPVWTGSCPCQPFSLAGKRKGADDDRHLWPTWTKLIEQRLPPVIFGEQVANADGRAWLAGVRADLEALGYAVGAADLCAAGVGAPHRRQRIFFGAVRAADYHGLRRQRLGQYAAQDRDQPPGDHAHGRGESGGLGHTDSHRAGRDTGAGVGQEGGPCLRPVGDGLGSPDSVGGLGHTHEQGLEGHRGLLGGPARAGVGRHAPAPGLDRRPWKYDAWVPCRDGKTRPVEPGIQLVAHGTPGRVGLLRAYGNAIVPQVAATFIEAFIQAIEE